MSNVKLFSVRDRSTTRCMLCRGECETLGAVESFVENYPALGFALCRECQSITFEEGGKNIGYNSADFEPEQYYQHYTHVGAGISAMLEPLAMLDKGGSLLDVGCGFGYVVDYWLKMKNQQAVGLEVAEYGKKGKKLLQAPIFHNYLGECPPVDDCFFDIVYSSEVIEHTTDPLSFCRSLKARCASDGVIVLTAPSSRAVLENHPESAKLAALSPYFHYFLPSKEGLNRLLAEAGFEYIHINDNGMRLYVWASMAPLPEIIDSHTSFDWQEYFRYLQLLADNSDIDVSSGARYRLFKDQWFRGYREEAYQSFLLFEQHIARHFNINLRTLRFEEYEQHIKKNDLHSAPAWLPMSLHLGSVILRKFEGKKNIARTMAIASAKITELLLSEVKFKQFSQEVEHYYPKILKNLKKLDRFSRVWNIFRGSGR